MPARGRNGLLQKLNNWSLSPADAANRPHEYLVLNTWQFRIVTVHRNRNLTKTVNAPVNWLSTYCPSVQSSSNCGSARRLNAERRSLDETTETLLGFVRVHRLFKLSLVDSSKVFADSFRLVFGGGCVHHFHLHESEPFTHLRLFLFALLLSQLCQKLFIFGRSLAVRLCLDQMRHQSFWRISMSVDAFMGDQLVACRGGYGYKLVSQQCRFQLEIVDHIA
ncbi:hypothetical protein KC360_g11 [Hortaea werneckii]|nr:hypothetical protein KC360_g11 [Hortaea werneckii]